MAYKPLDSRQTEHRSQLDRLASDSLPTLKTVLPAINKELTPVFEIKEPSTPSLVVSIYANSVQNPNTLRNRVNAPLNGTSELPFTSGTITLPSASGGNITPSPGSPVVLTISASRFMKCLVQITSSSQISVKTGIEGATLAAATLPAPDSGVLVIGYIVIRTNGGGVVQNIIGSDIFQYDGASSGGGTSVSTLPILVEDIKAGESILGGSSGPLAVYAKLKKMITISASNNKLDWVEGATTYQATLANTSYLYPYAALKTDIETKMLAQSGGIYTYIASEQKHKISKSIGNVSLLCAATNSFWPTGGFGSVTLAASTFFRAANIHTYIREPRLFKVNTTTDVAPPYIDDGLFSTLVPGTHRSRSFFGFITADTTVDSLGSVTRYGKISGLTGLTVGSTYYTNGATGQISTASVANSIEAGVAKTTTSIEINPFQFEMEPDTDVAPNTTDDIPAWLNEPELMSAASTDTVTHGFYGAGNYIVTAKADVGNPAQLKIMWSVDGGNSLKEYGTTFTLNQNYSASFGTGYWSDLIKVWCDSTGRVFIAYTYHDGTFYEVRGVWGSIDSNGELTLAQSNSGQASPWTDSVSPITQTFDNMLHDVQFNNGYLYCLMGGTNRFMYIQYSTNYGATWNNSTATYVKSGVSDSRQFIFGANDYVPVQMFVVNRPGAPTANRIAIAYAADDTNGDTVVTANYRLVLAYADSDTLATYATAIDLGNPAALSRWALPIGKCTMNAASTKFALNIILGHGNAIAAGTDTTGISGNNRSYVGLLDLSVSTPTFSSGAVPYYDSAMLFTNSAGVGGRTSYHNGFTSENTNGQRWSLNSSNILRISDTSLVLTAPDSMRGDFYHCYYVPDTTALGTNYPVTEFFNLLNSTFKPSECQFVASSTKNFVVYKETESIANNIVGGKVLAQEIIVDTSAKTERVTNGDFSGGMTGWSTVGANAPTVVSGELRVTGNSAAYQDITTVGGKWYRFSVVNRNSAPEIGFLRAYSYAKTNVHQGDDGDILMVQSLNNASNSTYQFAFQAKSTFTRVVLGALGGGTPNTHFVFFDNFSIKETDAQFGPFIDVAAKPNVDDEDVAGKIQVLSGSDGTAHVLLKKGIDFLNNSTYIEQPAYNNFKIRVESTATLWNKIPSEARDYGQTASSSVRTVSYDPLNPNYGVSVSLQNGTNQAYVFRLTTDGGVTWKTISTPGAYTQAAAVSSVYYYYWNPAVYVRDSKVFILIHTASNVHRGLYGTIAGNELTLLASNSGGVILDQGVFEMYHVQIAMNNNKMYVVGNRTSDGTGRIAVSSNFGQSWTNGVGVAGTETSVKSGATNAATGGTIPHWLGVINKPGDPTNNRVIVVVGNTSDSLNFFYTDNADLTLNWAPLIAVHSGGTGTVLSIGNKLSDDNQYLAIAVARSVAPNTVDLHVLNVSLATPTANTGSGTSLTSTFALALDGYNGYSAVGASYISINYSNHQHNNIMWTSATSLLMVNALGIDTATPKLILTKCSNVTSIATNLTFAQILSSTSSAAQATEGQMGKIGTDYWCSFVTKNATTTTWQTIGRARAVKITDPTPTTNTAPTVINITAVQEDAGNLASSQLGQNLGLVDIAGKLSHVGALIGVTLQSLSDRIISSLFKVNIDTFQSVFVNVLKSREINPAVEEWAKVPVKITNYGQDVAVWSFHKSGSKIAAFSKGTGIDSGQVWLSGNEGASWFNAGTISSGTGAVENNTIEYLYGRHAVKVSDDGTKFCVMYYFFTGATSIARTVYGEFDANGNVKNLDLSPLTPFNTGNSAHNNEHLAERSGKLYALALTAGPAAWINISANFGDTSWGTEISVKSLTTAATIGFAVGEPSTLAFDVASNGSGGDRVLVLGRDSADGFIKLWFSNDDGATWATAISLGIANTHLMAYKRNGNQVAAIIAANDANAGPSPIYAVYCSNITATTPVFTTQALTLTSVTSAGIGLAGQDGTLSVARSDAVVGHVRTIYNRIIFTSSTSFICALDIRASSGIEVPTIVKFPNVTSLSTYTDFTDESPATVHKVESQLVKSLAGEMYLIYKVSNSTATTDNFTSGRLVARQVYDPTPTTNVVVGLEGVPGQFLEDIAFKPNATTGGFAGRMQVSGDTIIFEKEDGAGFEQLFVNSLSAKNNGRFQ